MSQIHVETSARLETYVASFNTNLGIWLFKLHCWWLGVDDLCFGENSKLVLFKFNSVSKVNKKIHGLSAVWLFRKAFDDNALMKDINNILSAQFVYLRRFFNVTREIENMQLYNLAFSILFWLIFKAKRNFFYRICKQNQNFTRFFKRDSNDSRLSHRIEMLLLRPLWL